MQEYIQQKVNGLSLGEWISNEAIKLKIKPENIQICKTESNGWYCEVRYDRKNKQEQLNRLIIKEQYRRILEESARELGIDKRTFNKNEVESTITLLIKLKKTLKKLNLRLKLEKY